MICERCRRVLKAGDVYRYKDCDSNASSAGGGDLGYLREISEQDDGYHWSFALCRQPAYCIDSANRLTTAMNIISEKFELVNKVQLPRLSSDLSYILSVAERIARQNETVLRSFDELRGREPKLPCSQGYRKRKLSLVPRKPTETTPAKDKMVRHRPRRSATLQELLLVLNRKLHQTSTGFKHQ